MRTFLFKLHNNTLGYNQSVSHFIRGYSNNCTFCDITEYIEEEPETPLHLFFNCTVVENIRNKFSHWLFADLRERLPEPVPVPGPRRNIITDPVTRQEFFTVLERDNNCFNSVLFVVTKLFIKYIWDCKLRKCLPSLALLKNLVKSEINIIKFGRKDFVGIVVESNINFERE